MNRELQLYDGFILSRREKKHKRSRSDDSDSDDDYEKPKTDVLKCDNSVSSTDNSVYAENNHIYFNSAFNKKSIEMLVDKIAKINEEFDKLSRNKMIDIVRPKPIYLHITSYGGSLLHCFKAIDAVTRSKIEVHTIVEGYAASCGSILAVIGVKRYMGRYASILMHQLSSGAMGKYKEIEDEYGSCKMLMEQIIGLYEKHTTMSREQIIAQLDHDSWWNYETCLANGLVDGEWMEN